MTTRSKGLIAAGAVAVVALVLIVVAAFSAGSGSGSPSGSGGTPLVGSSVPPTAERATAVGSVGGLQDLLTKGSRAAWTRTDESGRVTMQLTCGSLDPEPDGRFALTDLELWFYLDRNSLRVTAPRGQFVWPRQDEEPESGDLRGGVELTLFPSEQPADGGARKPEMIARVASLRFESAMSQIETADPITVESAEFSFRGRGLTARISEVGRRLQYLRIGADPANRIVLTPGRSESGPDRDRTASRSSKPSDRSADSTDVAWYRAVFSGPVQLRQGDRSLDAAEMTGWARVVGGRVRMTDQPTSSDERSQTDGGATGNDGDGDGPVFDPDAPIELAWRGPLEIRSLQEEPDELRLDDLAALFVAPQGGDVRLSDRATSSWVACGTLQFAGSRRVVMLRAASRTEPARVSVAGTGTLAAAQLDVDMAEWPTVALRTADGARVEWAAQPDRALPAGTLEWSGPGEFTGVSDSGSIAPRQVRLTGAIRGSTQDEEGWTLGSDELSAEFDSDPATGESQLRDLLLAGSVRLEGGAGISVASDRLAARLESTAGDELSGEVEATGNVRGRADDGEVKSAGRVRINFVRRDGATELGDFEAEDRVYFVGADGIEIHGDRVAGNVQRQDLEAAGRPAVLARFTRQEQQSVSAGELQIDGSTRRFEVHGPGVLARARLDAQGQLMERMNASWSVSMEFDDLTGRGVIEGDSRCIVEQAGTERHLIVGDRLTVEITPHQPESTERSRRWLERALVEGSAFDAAAGGHSRVESRRYRAGPDGPVFEGLLSVESATIQARYEGRVLDLPGPGRLVVEDRRPNTGDAAPEAPRSSPRAARGTTVITWVQGVRVQGTLGHAEMTGGVRMLHRPADTTEVISLECEAMRAEFTSLDGLFTPGGATADDPAAELRALHATGGVLVRRGSVQIVCDRVVFDASTEEIVAFAEPGNLITVFDDKDGSQRAVESAALNVRTGNVRAVGRGMISIPR